MTEIKRSVFNPLICLWNNMIMLKYLKSTLLHWPIVKNKTIITSKLNKKGNKLINLFFILILKFRINNTAH